jgi:hypothetical protein
MDEPAILRRLDMDALTVVAGDTRIVQWPASGLKVETAAQANDLIGEAWSQDASWVAVPVDAFAPEVFQLKTRILGEITQRFANYRLGLAIIGDIPVALLQSQALQDYIREANQGANIWFVASFADLTERLGASR